MKRIVEELIDYYEEITRISGFWRLAEMDFQHLSGARNVTVDFQYDAVICVVCACLSL